VHVDSTELGSVVAQLGAKGKNASRLMPVVAEILHAAVSDVFDAEGPGWKDLAESTKKARRGTSYKILQDTGLSAAYLGNYYGADWAEVVGQTSYIEFHARGNENLPVRDPFDLGPFMDDVLADTAELLLQELAT
jgi:phage gpG-like protein